MAPLPARRRELVQAVKGLKIRARGPMQPHNVDSPFRSTIGNVAGHLPVTKEDKKETKKAIHSIDLMLVNYSHMACENTKPLHQNEHILLSVQNL